MGRAGIVGTQIKTLIKKDLLLKRRSILGTAIECLCPVGLLVVGCIALFFVDVPPKTVPYTTYEKESLPIVGGGMGGGGGGGQMAR